MEPIRRILRGYLDGLNRYGDFSGRASWGEYLSFAGVNLVIGLLLNGIAWLTDGGLFSLLSTLYAMAVLVPGLAITVRKIRGFSSEPGLR